MSDLAKLRKLSKLKFGSEEWDNVFHELIEGANPSQKTEYFETLKELNDQKISQDKYREENEGRKIIRYDIETFMPIYSGVKKWE